MFSTASNSGLHLPVNEPRAAPAHEDHEGSWGVVSYTGCSWDPGGNRFTPKSSLRKKSSLCVNVAPS